MNYLGSKRKLLSFLRDNTSNFLSQFNDLDRRRDVVFCDLFAGTGAVGSSFSNDYSTIIFNDIQYYSSTRIKVMANLAKRKRVDHFYNKNISKMIEKMNNLIPIEGYFFENYSPSDKNTYNRMYFTVENAKKIDACIEFISKLKNKTNLQKEIKSYLIISLMEAADKIANVTGVYEAYLKKFKVAAEKKLTLKKLITDINPRPKTKVYNTDASILIKKIKGDILYLDPPYNSRQYSSNYHILETLTKLDKPQIQGKTGIRKDIIKSVFSYKNDALNEVEKIIKNAKFKYIFISYNNNGNIEEDKMEKMIRKYGIVNVYRERYKTYKSNSKTNEKENYELLFCIKKW